MRYRRLSLRYTRTGREGARPWSGPAPFAVAQPQWRPAADVFRTADGTWARIEAAGMREEDFVLSLYQDALLVEGERRFALPPEATQVDAVEIAYGPLRVVIPLSHEVDRDRAQARYEAGLLLVHLPRRD